MHFGEKELNIKFDQEIQLLTQESETMGITEQILDIWEKKGIEKGRKSSIEQIAKNLIKKGLDIQVIHETTSLSIKQLEKLKKQLSEADAG